MIINTVEPNNRLGYNIGTFTMNNNETLTISMNDLFFDESKKYNSENKVHVHLFNIISNIFNDNKNLIDLLSKTNINKILLDYFDFLPFSFSDPIKYITKDHMLKIIKLEIYQYIQSNNKRIFFLRDQSSNKKDILHILAVTMKEYFFINYKKDMMKELLKNNSLILQQLIKYETNKKKLQISLAIYHNIPYIRINFFNKQGNQYNQIPLVINLDCNDLPNNIDFINNIYKKLHTKKDINFINEVNKVNQWNNNDKALYDLVFQLINNNNNNINNNINGIYIRTDNGNILHNIFHNINNIDNINNILHNINNMLYNINNILHNINNTNNINNINNINSNIRGNQRSIISQEQYDDSMSNSTHITQNQDSSSESINTQTIQFQEKSNDHLYLKNKRPNN
jgi:hypothetical protein